MMSIPTGHIYKITSPTGRVYVGKTTRINNRISYYRNSNKGGQKILDSSIKKYGWDQHIFEVIDEAPVDELNELEIKYIKEFNTFHYDNPNGMNLTKGGEGTLGRKHSKETIDLMIAKRIGTKRSEATKKLMSDLKKGKIPICALYTRTEKHLKILRQNNLGRVVPEEEVARRKQSRLNKLIEQHEAILQIDVDGKVVKEWQMLPKDIAKHFNAYDTNIVKCLNNKAEKGLGYIWKYKK
jgi:group I intron endonuclease